MSTIDYIDADEIARVIRPAEAIHGIRDALKAGVDPEADLPRVSAPLGSGEFLLMPSHSPTVAGIKIIAVAPDNPSSGLPRIQGVYLLCDAATLTPQLFIDGPGLTDLRTPAVSFAAVHDLLASRSTPLKVVFYGAGPQAIAHLHTLTDAYGTPSSAVAIVRTPANVLGAHVFDEIVTSGSPRAREVTVSADVIVCATSASTPLFADTDVRDDAVVIAVGSHHPTARELPGPLLGRADVIVEARTTALSEAGDVVMAIEEGELTAGDLLPMKDVITGDASLHRDRPVVFKSTGMSWEDLVLAETIAKRFRGDA